MKTAHFQRKPLITSQNLALGALSYTTSIGRQFKLEEILLRASVAISETITISRDSNNGSNYDTVLASRVMVSETDFVFRPQGECNFVSGDELKIQCTNANLTATVYVEVRTSEM